MYSLTTSQISGLTLYALRKGLYLKLADIANTLKIDYSQARRHEIAKKGIGLETLAKIAKEIYGLEIHEFFNLQNNLLQIYTDSITTAPPETIPSHNTHHFNLIRVDDHEMGYFIQEALKVVKLHQSLRK